MAKISKKRFPCKGSIEDAISAGYELIEELKSEVQEVVDGAEGGLAETPRIQTLMETADALDSYTEAPDFPTLPDGCDQPEVEWTENRRSGISRSTRRDNAVAALDAAISGIEQWCSDIGDELQELEDKESDDEDYMAACDDLRSELEQLKSYIEEAKSAAESAEFPGMYG